MPSAIEALRSLIGVQDPCLIPTDELERMQLDAISERFAEQRAQIRVLDRRARDVGIDAVKTFDDLVPLMFAHTNYKSYPDALIASGNWTALLLWFDSLATASMTDVDISDITDIDTFIDRLTASGHTVACSSGTTGKCAFLPQAPGDLDSLARQLAAYISWPDPPVAQDGTHPVFRLGMASGPHRGPMQIPMFEPWGPVTSFAIHYQVSEVNRMGAMRRALIDGTASPDDITRFEHETTERAARGNTARQEWARTLVEHRHEPCLIYGGIAELWRASQYARELGVADGDFHPETTISMGGGLKGGSIPDDAWETTAKFFGDARWYRYYGMTEINSTMLLCEAGVYHRPAWVAMLLLDESGEQLQAPLDGDERRVGRAAYFDVSVEGHWGGVVTGDQITVQGGTCACGRPGPVILPNIVRYAELGRGNDDKLTCGGTIDSYLRGFIDA